MDLGKRLAKVASLIEPADTMADVGCDHGYLSIYLVEQKRCRRVIAMDVNKGPLQKARENIQKYGYGDYIETRLSDGLNKLRMNEAEGYVCAGMGGPLALEILWNDRDKIKDMKQIVLQPQSELWMVRRILKQWGFEIEKEDIEYEDGKYYFMMRIRPTENLNMENFPQNESLFGCNYAMAEETENASEYPEWMSMDPIGFEMISEEEIQSLAYELFARELLETKNPLLYEYIRKEERRLLEIYASLSKQEDSPKCRERMATVEKEIVIHQWALSQYETE